MVYENNSPNSTKQEIFNQIDQDILSQKKQGSGISQKTNSNYRFVIALDIIALFIAMVGVLFVYHIFREQQVELVSGHQGIKVLESTLLDEINKQYAQDMADMMKRLDDANERVASLELAHAEELARIAAEAEAEIVRQRAIIQAELESALEGKSESEREVIRQQYEAQAREMEEVARREVLLREQQEEERHQQLLVDMAQANEKETQELAALRSRMGEMQSQLKEVEERETVQFNRDAGLRQFDDSIVAQLMATRQFVDSTNFNNMNRTLSRISQLYRNPPAGYSQQRQEADDYFVEIIQELAKLFGTYNVQVTTISNLEATLSNENEKFQIQLSNENARYAELEQNFVNARGRIITNVIQTVVTQIVTNHSVLTQAITNQSVLTQMNDTQTVLTQFVTNNSVLTQETVKQTSAERRAAADIAKMIKRGDDFAKKKQYERAVNSYQDVIRQTIDENAEPAVQKLYDAMLLELKGENVVMPRSLEDNVKKLLKDTRYSETGYSVVYLKEPVGYVADILDKDNVLLLLLPRERLRRNQDIEIYRVTSQNGIVLEKVGEFRAKKTEKSTFKAEMMNHNVKLGDLIYIK